MSIETLITCTMPDDMRRRGSPVVRGTERGWQVLRPDADEEQYISIARDVDEWASIECDDLSPRDLRMDLTDETGEQHAVWWCADRFGFRRAGANIRWSFFDGCWTLSARHDCMVATDLTADDGFSSEWARVHTDEARLHFLADLVEWLIAQGQKLRAEMAAEAAAGAAGGVA